MEKCGFKAALLNAASVSVQQQVTVSVSGSDLVVRGGEFCVLSGSTALLTAAVQVKWRDAAVTKNMDYTRTDPQVINI